MNGEEVVFEGWDDYMEEVSHSTWLLLDLRETLHTSMVHILSLGELKDWCAEMEDKGHDHFTQEVFEGCEDPNVILLARLYGQVVKTYKQLCALNGLPEYKDEEEV